jgi:hypothetical protein
LESEKQAFTRSKISSEYKLKDATASLESAQSRVEYMTADWNNLQTRIRKRQDDTVVNPVLLAGLPPHADIKQIAAKLHELSEKAATGGQYAAIGTLYGFTLLVKTEVLKTKDLDFKDIRFFVQGEGGIKYSYNNGHIAADPKLATLNFLNALEKIPTLIDNEQKKITELQRDIPVLREVVNSAWTKEKSLGELKSELAAVERKIQLSITPVSQAEDAPAEQNSKSQRGKKNTVAKEQINTSKRVKI